MTNVDMVLDALADDYEGIEQIAHICGNFGKNMELDEIQEILDKLVFNKLVKVIEKISDEQYKWYGLTRKGRKIQKEIT